MLQLYKNYIYVPMYEAVFSVVICLFVKMVQHICIELDEDDMIFLYINVSVFLLMNTQFSLLMY